FVGGEAAAQDRLHAEHAWELPRHLCAADPLRTVRIREVEAVGRVERDRLEQLLLLAPANEVRIVDPDDLEVPLRAGSVDVDEAIRMRKRKRTKEQPVDEAEHRDVCGNAE